MLEWGDKIKFLKSVEQSTGETPLALLNRTTPTEWTVEYWDAFNALSGSRNFTAAGPASIPMSEILSYFCIYGITDLDERATLISIIQSLDKVYLEHHAKKAKVK